jgi:four helix bundle protein
MGLVEHLYRVTAGFPGSELYGLTSQIRRAAVSVPVPTNIAEGAARAGSRELRHFLSIAQGSLSELDTMIDIAGRLGYLADPAVSQSLIDAVSGLISKLRQSLPD